MKKQIKLIATLLLVLPIALLNSCGGDDPIEEAIDVVENDVNDTIVNETYYQIPSPDEMFGFIKECGLAFNGELLNPTQSVDSYSGPKSQALNFGIYSADLAYTAAFQEFNETTKYFGTIQKLAEPIGISSAFDKALIERIQKSLDNPDSLVAITNTSYFSAIDYLEQNEQGDKLGIIASAGWLETVYVVANTTDFDKNKAAVERLADQRLTLDNLLAYLEKYKNKEDVKEVFGWCKELETVFAQIPEEKDAESGISFKKKDNGKMVLGGGGTSVSITKKQFNAIKEKVNEIRNKIVKTEA